MINLYKPLGIIALAAMICTAVSVRAAEPQGKKNAPNTYVDQAHPISVDVRPQVFAMMCALDAAGFESDANTKDQSQGRIQLRQQMLALHGPAVDALRKFYKDHALADPAATLSRFMSFALAAGPPPQFTFEMNRDALPPDALALEGFNVILANFYREAQLDQLWQHYQPDYQRGVELYRAPLADLVVEATTYLREIVRPTASRTFTVYVDPLVGGKTNFRNYGDHYYLVVGTGADIPIDDMRHSFLHFLLDPMAIRYRTEALRAEPLLAYAGRAPQLPVEFRDDFPAFFDECLVRAVELRLRHLSPENLSAEIDRAETSGYVMVRPIYSGLSGYEKAEPGMGLYLPDLLKRIDVPAEARRLRGVTFADAAGPASVHGGVPAGADKPAATVDPVEGDLAEGQRQISARNGTAAAAAFDRVLATSPNDPRATYGLAIASALLGQPDRARELFAKVIAAAASTDEGVKKPDPSSLSWSHIYLGRMYDVEGNRELAVTEYKAALQVNDAPETARTAAQRGVDAGYQTPPRDVPTGSKQ
jgi:tetratricopeptide (TPR) repeat protein